MITLERQYQPSVTNIAIRFGYDEDIKRQIVTIGSRYTKTHRCWYIAYFTDHRRFNIAVKNRLPDPGLLYHSDRGIQYACNDFGTLICQWKCVQSMSRKGNCWDNAVAESFFKTIKIECLYRHSFTSFNQVYSVIFDYIDGWYNTVRIHSSLSGLSPLDVFILKSSDINVA